MTEHDTDTNRDESAIADRDPKGRFAPGNRGRPVGTKTRATRAVEVLLEGEAEGLTRKAVELALAGDVQALRLCIDRLSPVRKPEGRCVEIPALAEAKTPADQARAVLQAVAAGEVPTDVGDALLSSIASVCKIVETSELLTRIEALESPQ